MNDIVRQVRSLHLPPAAPAGAAVVGAAAGLLAADGAAAVAAGVAIGVVGLPAAVADLRERRIPNEVVLVALAAAAVIALAATVAGSGPALARALGGAAAAGLPMLAIHLVSPAGLGFGDVKLAAALGALLGVVAWVLGLLMLAAASVVALLGVAVLPSWRRSIPFGACLAFGALTMLAAAGWVSDAWALR